MSKIFSFFGLITLLGCLSLTLLAQGQRKTQEIYTSPYKRWLDDDVRYITSEEERQTFKRLHTDEEREQFIEQFWLRRDPTPDTEENEFKDAYCQRIAYSNEKFSFGKTLGWKSDRGRIYITYGPPNEIQVQNDVEEIWLYHKLPEFKGDARLRFINLDRTGEFKFQPQ